MIDAIGIINRVIEEHHKIRDNIKLAGDSLNDVEASIIINNAYSEWTQSSVEELTVKRGYLIQAVSALAQGLTTHFGFEEKYLPPLFGEFLTKALLHEHQGVQRQIEIAKKTITEMEIDKLDRQEMIKQKTLVQDNINHLLQAVEEHAGHEEIILLMIRGGLESSGNT